MSQRNPMNERYQNDAPKGKTRRSAASAKPTTKAAASVRLEGDKKPQKKGLFASASKPAQNTPAKKTASREERMRYYDPGTPEYKKWRRLWWITIVGALVCTFLAFILQGVLAPDQMWISYTSLGFGYGMLFVALYIDIAKVRKIRNAYADNKATARTKEATRARKAEKAAEKAAAEARLAEAQARQAERAQRKGPFGLFGKKAEPAAAETGEEVSGE